MIGIADIGYFLLSLSLHFGAYYNIFRCGLADETKAPRKRRHREAIENPPPEGGGCAAGNDGIKRLAAV